MLGLILNNLMITFKEYFEIFCEMARPAKSFDDSSMNKAYGDSLKKFKKLGVQNANTFTIWDFIFKQLPEFFQDPKFLESKQKQSGTNLRIFVLHLLNRYADKVDWNQLAIDINNISKIENYISRPDRGNRHKGLNTIIPQEKKNNIMNKRHDKVANDIRDILKRY